jgi:phage tail sheath protein FI
VIDYRNLLRSTSYAVLDSGYKYQYDKYNDVYRWVPLNGDTAGLCVRTDNTRDPWFSPAGFNRGQIKNVVKLAFNPDKADRDQLYKNGINPVVNFPGQGVVLYGDKTLLAKPSAFDRINVRRLFIVLEKAIATASKFTLFEFNDEFTRASFRNLVEPFLRDVQGRRGIYDFRVVCDDTNNTPEVIDRNEFRGDIYIKPARSINFIQLNFVAVRTGVEFEEIVGRF